MNSHQLIDQRSHEMHQVIVRILRDDDSVLSVVRSQIEQRLADPDYSDSLKDCLREWMAIIATGVDRIISVLEGKSEEAVRLRHNSPFAILMPQEERLAILKKYRRDETVGTGTYPSGV